MLVVSPHPDDAEFGVAGTVAGRIRAGQSVVYAVCTSGDKGSGDRTVDPRALAVRREGEQLAAAQVLGVREVVFLRYPDQGLEDTPGFRKEIVRLIRRYRPETVATADPYRRYIWHRDHRIAGQVVLDAVYPYARDHLAYPDLLAAGLEPHKVREVLLWGTEDINYRSDITDTFAIKLAALFCHQSQVGDRAGLEAWLRERAQGFARGDGFALAEAFHRVEVRP